MRISIVLLLAVLVAGLATPSSAQIRRTDEDVPVLITADRLNYDRNEQRVIATGNVRISQGNRVVLADRVVYDQRRRTVIATGNVSMTEPSGEVAFADRIEFTDDLKEGVIEQFGLLFPDNTRVAATGARRIEGRRTDMSKVVFSPCNLCESDPTRAPLWQLKAQRVVHHQDTKDIEYFNAFFEVFGIPILYMPYFSHPDPTVKRRSGFLAPTYGNDSRLGFFIRVPYFLVLGPDKDITIAPLITTQNRAALFARYRQRFKNGGIVIDTSVTRVSQRDPNTGDKVPGDRTRGYVFSRFRYDLSPNWRVGFDANWTSDDTYLRDYDISSTDSLWSTGWIEGFHGRNYTNVRTYYFQGLRDEDIQARTPFILPLAEYSMFGTPRGRWGRWHFETSALGLTRQEGTDSHRLSFTAGWQLPFTAPIGYKLTLTANVNGDFYWISDQPQLNQSDFSGVQARLYPQVAVDWRYPFVRELGNVRQVLEPQVQLVAAPASLNSSDIPNEDSRDFEFDDTNLFRLNRFPGRDRVSDGVRLVYGLGTSFIGNRGGRTEFFLGQSFRLVGENDLAEQTGLHDRLSDLVGRVSINPGNFLNLTYRFRFDPIERRMRRNEVTMSAALLDTRLAVTYLDFPDDNPDDNLPRRQEVAFAASTQLTKFWTVFGAARYDLGDDPGFLSWSVGGQFKNECCTIRISYNRKNFQDRDLRPDTTILIQIVFKHLGEFATSGG